MKIYEISLESLGPVFVGSGEILKKSAYIYDRKEGRVYIPDERKMINWIVANNLSNSYENFFYYNENKTKDLYSWFKLNNVLGSYKKLMKYSMPVGDLSRDKRKGLNDIQLFIKGGDGKAYIPGSSLKGAIRNILFAEKNRFSNPKYFSDYLNKRENIKYIERKSVQEDKESFGRKINERDYEDIMKYLLISDSKPISVEDFIIVQKIDKNVKGRESSISTFRECIKPGTKIKFQMKIKDEFKMNIEDIKSAIEKFYNDIDYYFLQEFGIEEREGAFIYLGGGTGFVSKTSTYSVLGDNEESIDIVGKILSQRTDSRHMKWTKMNNIAPQALKLTKYKNEYYEMGLCKISFKEVKI